MEHVKRVAHTVQEALDRLARQYGEDAVRDACRRYLGIGQSVQHKEGEEDAG